MHNMCFKRSWLRRTLYPNRLMGLISNKQTFFLMTLRDYFQSSFWDAVKQNKFPPATVLWKIRSSLGKRFTDRLASFILRELADTPQETFDPDMNVSFVKELKVG